MWVFQFVRFKNLIIVALTQCLLYFLLIIPSFRVHSITPSLDDFHFFLLVLTTMIIAASGYIVNDILDYEIDQFNKPDKVFIGNKITQSKAWFFYFGIMALGGFISIYLALYVKQFPLFFIYPIAVGLLWLYSKYFKKQVLIGNVVVSIFCAFVAGIVAFAERAAIRNLTEINEEIGSKLVFLFWCYLTFAFLSTLFREIIKDIEDIKGDKNENCKTLPIVWGINNAKSVAFLIGFVLWISVIFFGLWLLRNEEIIGIIFSIIGILAPLGFALIKLKQAQSKNDFHKLSQLAKLTMISGLILLIIISL